jgi:hypothetical protein
MKTPYQMLHIKRFTKVANDPMVHGAGAVNVVGIGSNEDRRNYVTRLDEVQCPASTPIRTSNAVPWNGSIGSGLAVEGSPSEGRLGVELGRSGQFNGL